MRRLRTDMLDRALDDFERLAELGARFQRAGVTLRGIVERRERQQLGGVEPIHMVEVEPGVFQSARRAPVNELLEDARALRAALRPQVVLDAVVTPGRRR